MQNRAPAAGGLAGPGPRAKARNTASAQASLPGQFADDVRVAGNCSAVAVPKLTSSRPGANSEAAHKAPSILRNETKDLMLTLVLKSIFLAMEMDLHMAFLMALAVAFSVIESHL